MLATQFPQHVPELLAYMGDIIKASKQFKWPSWVIYDAYRQCMEETGQKDWSKVDMPDHSQDGRRHPLGVRGVSA